MIQIVYVDFEGRMLQGTIQYFAIPCFAMIGLFIKRTFMRKLIIIIKLLVADIV